MTRKLTDQDRQAVDLVLDRFTTMAREDGVIAVDGAPAEPHVQSVEQILNVLAAMPAPEPAPDLVARTLARIDAMSPSGVMTDVRPPAAFIDPNQLNA
jgi:hypothetical protein